MHHLGLIQASEPIEIVRRVRNFMRYYLDDDTIAWQATKTNCRINARICWATLVPTVDLAWVADMVPDGSASSGFENTTMLEWNCRRKEWRANPSSVAMMVRFFKKGEEHDGHSLVLYKYGSDVVTFQAYYDVAEMQCVLADVFDWMDCRLLEKLMHDQPVSPADFGLKGEDRSGLLDATTVYLSGKCSYLAH